jgi:tetratricopeptide (TPR) repeat protein
MIAVMNRSVVLAFVSTVFMAAGAATAGLSYASETPGASSSAPSAVMQTAYTHLVSGKPELAIAEYTAALSLSGISISDRARSLLNRALAHQKVGAHQSAIADYSSAIGLDALSANTRAVALYNRGIAHSKMNKHAAAVDDYTNALYLDPYLSEAYYSRANALRDTGQYDYALVDYAKAVKFNYPHLHLAMYGQALTLAKLGHSDEATAALFRAYSIKPDFKPARERLSELGIDVPSRPSERQIRLAVLPTRNLLADDIVTGSTKAPSTGLAKLVLREPAAPSAALLNGVKPDQPRTFIAKVQTPIKPVVKQQVAKAVKPQKPQDVSVSQVAAVPAIPKKIATLPAPVKIAPVSAPAEKVATNLTVAAPSVSKKLEGWTVQLVSLRDADKAWDNWSALKKRHGSLLGDKTAAVVKADVDGQGTYYRLRVHKLEKADAKKLCKQLKRKGTGCFISHAG